MGEPTGDRASVNRSAENVSRRKFLSQGAAASVGAVAITGTGSQASAQANGSVRWDFTVGCGRDRRRCRRTAGGHRGAG